METCGIKTRSIFDIIEEKKEMPEGFAWSKSSSGLVYSPEERLHDGSLSTSVPSGKSKTNRYVLTLQGLVKYKTKDQSIPSAFLRFDNPRLEKVEDRDLNMCGFKLTGYKGAFEFLCKNIAEQEQWIDKLRKICISLNISYRYSFGKMLGKGNFAKVHLSQRKKDGASFAIKTIEKSKIMENPRNLQSMHREIMILRKIDHPNVIKLWEVYENDMYVHLVMEYLKGGELFQKLQSKGVYSEKDAATAIRHVLEALDYCHIRNIVHRDLKPENLILSELGSDGELKIADFGLATIVDPSVPEKLRCGSPGYVAPEILNNLGYGTKADIFSAGIILCVMLTGVSPFHGKSYQDVLSKNKEGTVCMTQPHWAFVNEEAKDLVGRMVAKNPQERVTAKEALQHPWFRSEHASTTILSNAQENMRKYHNKQNENRFNVGKIKPEFSTVTCTPLLNARFAGQDSPLILPMSAQGGSGGRSPAILPRRCGPEEKKSETKPTLLIRDINDKFKLAKKLSSFKMKPGGMAAAPTNDDDSADFNATEMDEKPTEMRPAANVKPLHRSFVPQNFLGRMLPPTPGPTQKKSMSYLKSFATPMQSRRLFNNSQNGGKERSYFKKLVDVKVSEESKKPTTSTFSNPVPEEAKKPASSAFNNPAVEPATTQNLSDSLNPIVMTPRNHVNELRDPQNVIRESSNSSETEVHIDRFETALSHQSQAGSTPPSEGLDQSRKDTPKFGPEGPPFQPRKAGTVPTQLRKPQISPIRKVDSVKQRLREELQY